MKRKIILVITISIFIFACNKQKVVENDGLLGKWQLSEYYNGYANGGDFSWHNVSLEQSHTLEFLANSQYIRKEISGGVTQECAGTFPLFPGNKLEVTTTCNTSVEKMEITQSTNSCLILDCPNIEG